MADRAGLTAVGPDDGLSFPCYVADDGKTMYEHMLELAGMSGCDIFLNAEGHVIFKKYEEGKPVTFKYGKDIVDATLQENNPAVSGVRVYEESPSSSMGEDTAHWLSKDTMGGACGDEDDSHVINNPAIKDKDTADKVAQNYLEKHAVTLSGTIKAIGNSNVGLGDTIRIKEAPDERMNGEFEAVRVNHTIDGKEGFITTIGWIRKPKVSKSEPPVVQKPAAPAPPKKPSFLEKMLEEANQALEDAKEALADALDSAPEALDEMLRKVNDARAEIDQIAEALLKEADKAKDEALKAADEPLKMADDLKKELEAKKKEMQRAIDDVISKYEELKQVAMAEVDAAEQEYRRLKSEAQQQARTTAQAAKGAADKAIEVSTAIKTSSRADRRSGAGWTALKEIESKQAEIDRRRISPPAPIKRNEADQHQKLDSLLSRSSRRSTTEQPAGGEAGPGKVEQQRA
jgi:hypothetical protein